MKKIFILIIVVFGVVAARAQAVTQSNVQGKWLLSSYSADGYSVDFINKTYSISDDLKETYEGEDIALLENDMQIMIEMGQGATLEFKGSTIIRTQTMDGETSTDERSFKIANGQMILPAGEDGWQEEQSSAISFKDGSLVLYQEEAGLETVYKRVK